MRLLVGTLLATALTSCIIYEERIRTVTVPCRDVCTDPTDPTDTTGETDPGIEIDPDLFLSVSSGFAGDVVLTTLESRDRRNFAAFEAITFDRDITVEDRIVRDDEVVLVLAIAEEAASGPIEVVVDYDGVPRRLEEPFEVIGDEPTDTGTTDTGTTDTGSTDTGGTDATDTGTP